MENNNLTTFNVGGTHGENKFGGIPQGQSQNGQTNTVEQGETKLKNYVYSNRLSIDENMTKEMNLPSYIKGKTFANASKAIDNKFKDRNDKHSLETKNVFLDRLKQAQETLKQQEQERAQQIAQSIQSNQQEIPDMMNGQIPEGMEEYTEQHQQEQPQQFFNGGNLNLREVGNMTGGMSGMAGKASPYVGAASGAMSLANLAQGNGASPDKFTSALSGAQTGAQAGMAFGPWGAGVGAVLGIGAGLLGSNKANKTHLKSLNDQAIMTNSQFQDNNFAKGGYLTNKTSQYDDGRYLEEDPINPLFKPTNTIPQVGAGKPSDFLGYDVKPKNILPKVPLADDLIKPVTKEQIQMYQLSKGIAKPGDKGYGNFGPKTTAQFEIDKQNWTPETPDTSMLKPKEQDFVEPTGMRQSMEDYYQKNKITSTDSTQDNQSSWLGTNGDKMLKYAPIAMNAYQLSQLKKPDNQRLKRLDDKYKAQYVDEAQLQNIANQEMTNTINSISQSGASQGAIRNSMLSAGLNKTKALSDAYMKANAENRATDDKAQQFNLGVNQFNTQTQHQESENWEKNNAAYRNEKSKYLASIGTDLGSIGKEEVNKNQIAEALGYSWDGKYMVNKKTGEKKTYEDIVNQTKQNSYGGYLKMNKIGRR